MSKDVFASIFPLGVVSQDSVELLKNAGIRLITNPFGRKITPQELAQSVGNAQALIAGTEKITEDLFKNSPNLRLISRVGVGLDSVDLSLCKQYDVRVAFTPDAHVGAVAELALGMILSACRGIALVDKKMRHGEWLRYTGRLLSGSTVGLIGLGKVARHLVYLLSPFGVDIKAFDPVADEAYASTNNIDLLPLDELLGESDIISIHAPLNNSTKNLINKDALKLMKQSSILINTSRGGIVNEPDLFDALTEDNIGFAALDVFTEEPYSGNLTQLDNCIVTSHIGSNTTKTRAQMEYEAAQAVVDYFDGKKLANEVEIA